MTLATTALMLLLCRGASVVSPGDEGGAITSGQIYTGAIYRGDLDTYTFNATAGNSFFASAYATQTPAFDIYMYVIAPDGTFLYDDYGSYVRYAQTASQTGTYTVVLSRWNGDDAGNYGFNAVVVPGASVVSPGDEGGMMTSGQSYMGAVFRGDLDTYTFNATSGNSITVSVSNAQGSTFDPWLFVYGPNGSELDQDFGQTVSYAATVTQTGVYTVIVARWNGDDAGNYSLSVTGATGGGGGGSPSEPQTDGEQLGCNCSDSPGRVLVGQPINVASGNMSEETLDYQSAGANRLSFIRYYNSSISNGPATFATSLGANWRSTYDRYIRIVSSSNVLVEHADGQVLSFTLTSGVWSPNTDIDLKLTQVGSGIGSTWTLAIATTPSRRTRRSAQPSAVDLDQGA